VQKHAVFKADALVDAGRIDDAIDWLAAANRAERNPALEIRMLRLREEAARLAESAPGRSPWPPTYDDPFPDVTGRLPEIRVALLDEELLGGAVAHHGALLVRNLLSNDEALHVIAGIQRAKAQRERQGRDGSDIEGRAWYTPYPQSYGPRTRARIEQRGGIWMADSPANTALVLDLLRTRGVIDVIARHLGERPCFSLQKTTLRQLEPVFRPTSWHQDGAFLGADVRTINVWVALTRCGGDLPTPGLEVVPTRVHELLSVEGGVVVSGIAPELIDAVTRETPTVRPEFEPGDGLIFDERFLHSTYLHPNMTEDRYALECWLFAPSHRPQDYQPFLA
jgi:hypothetical protein